MEDSEGQQRKGLWFKNQVSDIVYLIFNSDHLIAMPLKLSQYTNCA